MSFEVTHFVSQPLSLRDSPWFFVLVLRVSSTRTRTRRCGNEYDYEYHFIEYEYERNQECATSKRVSEGPAMEDVLSDVTSSLAYTLFEIEPNRETSKRTLGGHRKVQLQPW